MLLALNEFGNLTRRQRVRREDAGTRLVITVTKNRADKKIQEPKLFGWKGDDFYLRVLKLYNEAM